MSKLLVNLVYSKICGSASRKAVLVALADRASDDGSGVYVSKTRISAETELSRSTVVSVCQELEAEGVLTAVGKRTGNHGYTVVYHMQCAKIQSLPDAWSKCTNPDTLDADLGNETDEAFQVADHATLEKVQVSNPTRSSVALCDKNRPYRTIDKNSNFSENKKPVAQAVRTSAFALWEANRFRSSDPERARELEAEAEALAVAELAAERGDHSKQKSSKKRG